MTCASSGRCHNRVAQNRPVDVCNKRVQSAAEQCVPQQSAEKQLTGWCESDRGRSGSRHRRRTRNQARHCGALHTTRESNTCVRKGSSKQRMRTHGRWVGSSGSCRCSSALRTTVCVQTDTISATEERKKSENEGSAEQRGAPIGRFRS